MKVVICTPSLSGVMEPYKKSFEASLPILEKAGYEVFFVQELQCPYISCARATMTRKALDANADIIVYIDYDIEWGPQDLLTLISTEDDCAAGTYRYKKDEEEYMGALITDADGKAEVREDGNIKAFRVPAGFLKLTRRAIRLIMRDNPELVYGLPESPSVDLFGHGAYKGTWYGEDMAFCRRWIDAGREIALIPNLNLNHHSSDKVFAGNFHEYMLRQPGGSKA